MFILMTLFKSLDYDTAKYISWTFHSFIFGVSGLTVLMDMKTKNY